MHPLQFRMFATVSFTPLWWDCWLPTPSIQWPLVNSCVEWLYSIISISFLLMAPLTPFQLMVSPSILLFNFEINFSPAAQKTHLPDLETFDGLKDVMALCSLIELGNVISLWSYELTPDNQRERETMIFTHMRIHRLITWIFYLYEVSDEDSNVVADGKQDIYW